MDIKCIRCKGRLHCGRAFCPIYAKAESQFRSQELSDDFSGASPNVFVGRANYPNVNVGILSPPEKTDAWLHDAPRHWAKNTFTIQSIISLRSRLINSRFVSDVRNPDRFLEAGKEISQAEKPVDVEVTLEKKPTVSRNFIPNIIPMGPTAELKKVEITSNPSIPTKVDKIVSDTDLRAVEAMDYLYKKEFDEHYLTKLLSVGNLGVAAQRRLVPTRWAITAVDDTVGKRLLEEIRDYSTADFQCYFGGHLGNYYLIMFFPEIWGYELFETYLPKSLWNQSDQVGFVTDYESFDGRKDYAFNTAGGYYAARLPILEKLSSMKRQASVLALRFITEEYFCPLGVWVVREATRKALKNEPLTFNSQEEMLSYAKRVIANRFKYEADRILSKSRILTEMKTQKKLWHFA